MGTGAGAGTVRGAAAAAAGSGALAPGNVNARASPCRSDGAHGPFCAALAEKRSDGCNRSGREGLFVECFVRGPCPESWPRTALSPDPGLVGKPVSAWLPASRQEDGDTLNA